jgi:hypothetical protein
VAPKPTSAVRLYFIPSVLACSLLWRSPSAHSGPSHSFGVSLCRTGLQLSLCRQSRKSILGATLVILKAKASRANFARWRLHSPCPCPTAYKLHEGVQDTPHTRFGELCLIGPIIIMSAIVTQATQESLRPHPPAWGQPR